MFIKQCLTLFKPKSRLSVTSEKRKAYFRYREALRFQLTSR